MATPVFNGWTAFKAIPELIVCVDDESFVKAPVRPNPPPPMTNGPAPGWNVIDDAARAAAAFVDDSRVVPDMK
ncbi:MAG: hypothetical protein ACKOCW_04600 [Planctomycetaceae bacterium]